MAKNSDIRKNKHLTMEDPTTVSYEIKHHWQEHRNSFSSSDAPSPCS